jgi:uncharacterized RDD family membrane protein YckC
MESSGAPGTPPEGADQPAAAAPPPPPPPITLPPAAPAPAAASTTPGWVGAITSQQTIAGAGGLTYADVPARLIAYIIDVVIMAVAFGILYGIFFALFIGSALGGFDFLFFVWFVVLLLIYAAGSAIYFIYTWTKMRGSPGMRVLGLEVLNAADGAVLTQPQAIRRWLFLFGPFVLSQAAALMLGGLGTIVSLLVFGYVIYLLYTTASSPTRQGFHDVQAGTVVVKVGR